MADETFFTTTPSGRVPPEIDITVAHSARVYNYWLGGKDNFAADREAGQRALEAYPNLASSARASRGFLVRAVRYLAGEAGIRQFLDIGTGIPTANNTHEVAQAVAPDARVVYVDNDPIVLAHARALLTSSPEGVTSYIDADLHDPEAVLAGARDRLDFSRPVAVSLLTILHLFPDEEDPYGIVATIMDAMAPDSHLAIAHPAADVETAEVAEATARLNRLMRQQTTLRTQAEVARFFDGLDLVEPGVVRAPQWRPASGEDGAAPAALWGGVGRKP